MAPSDAAVVCQYGTGQRGGEPDSEGRRALWQPRGLAVAADGSLLVADYTAHCVFRFGSGGDFRGTVAAGEEGKMLPTVDPLKDIDRPTRAPEGDGYLLKRPVDVCANGEGGVFVLDAESCLVQRFGAAGGAADVVVPPPGAPPQKSLHTPEAVKNPRALTLAPDGGLVVTDTWSHRVLHFAPLGGEGVPGGPRVLAGSANSCGAQADQLCFPSCAAFDLDGGLLVADTNNHRVQRFAPGEAAGVTVAGSAEGRRGAGPAELDMPTGICVDPRDGSLLVADRCNARLLRFPRGCRAGDRGEVVAGPDALSRPWGVCTGPGGEVFVSDERRAVVLRLELEPVGSQATLPASATAAAPAAAVQPAAAATRPAAPRPAAAFAPPTRAAAGAMEGLD